LPEGCAWQGLLALCAKGSQVWEQAAGQHQRARLLGDEQGCWGVSAALQTRADRARPPRGGRAAHVVHPPRGERRGALRQHCDRLWRGALRPGIAGGRLSGLVTLRCWSAAACGGRARARADRFGVCWPPPAARAPAAPWERGCRAGRRQSIPHGRHTILLPPGAPACRTALTQQRRGCRRAPPLTHGCHRMQTSCT